MGRLTVTRLGIAAISTVVALSMVTQALAAGGGATSYRGGLARTGSYEAKAPKSGAVTQRWRYETGSFVRASAAVLGESVLFGSGDGFFYSLNSKDGKLQWRYQAGKPIYSTATIDNSVAYFTDGDGSLYAVDALTGGERWVKRQEKAVRREGWDFWHSSPAVVDGIVYYGSGDGSVLAVSAVDGQTVWSFKTKGRVRSSPSYADGAIYVASWDASLYALDARTGEMRWKFRTGDAIQCAPAIGNGLVYITSRDCHLYAVDATTGTKRWVVDFPGSWVLTSPALADNKVVVGSSDLQSVDCFDADTGHRIWRFDAQNNVLSSPCIVDGLVYACGWDGYIHALKLDSGKEVGFRGYVEGQIQSSPVPSASSIYVGSDDHCMYKLQ